MTIRQRIVFDLMIALTTRNRHDTGRFATAARSDRAERKKQPDYEVRDEVHDGVGPLGRYGRPTRSPGRDANDGKAIASIAEIRSNWE